MDLSSSVYSEETPTALAGERRHPSPRA
jgi:hypothetical protein